MKSEQRFGANYASKLALVSSAIFLFAFVTIALAAASVDETDLTSYGAANEVNLGTDGWIYISDATAQEIWRVSPDDGSYTLYKGLGTVVDARSDSAGRIWWTDGATTFNALTIGSTTKSTWSLLNYESLNGVAFDDTGNLWMSEFFGSAAKIHRFSPTTNQHCTYTIAGGIPSNYIRYHNGVLWLINWSGEKIVRFDPDTLAVTQWPTAAGNFEWGFDIDSDGHIWWADLTASISSLNPENNERSRYEIPTLTGSTALMVNADGNRISYTDSSENTVGWLVPNLASSETTALTVSTATATETCADLGPGATSAIVVETGTFDWTAGTLTTVVDTGGWTIYGLAAGADPFGISLGGDYHWVSDNGRQKLLRFSVPTVNTDTQDIPLDAGWGMISSYVDPQDPTIETVLSGIVDDLILVKDGQGLVYWPDLGINDIGAWDFHDGYQLYMTAASTLTINGSQVVPENAPLDLPASWSLDSYLRDGPMPTETALASINGQVLLVKNNFGEVYWPAYNINQIGDMQPGQGYLVNMSSPGTLTYPVN